MSDSDSILPSAVSLEDSSDDFDSSSSLESMTESDDEKDSLLLKNFKEKGSKVGVQRVVSVKVEKIFSGTAYHEGGKNFVHGMLIFNIVLTGLTPFFTRRSTMSI